MNENSKDRSAAEPPGPSADRGVWTAARFLFPLSTSRGDARSTDWANSVRWIVPFGVVVAILWAGVFRGSWRLFGETGNLRVVPALAVVLLECLLTGPFLAMGLARTAHLLAGERPRSDSLEPDTPLSPVGTLVLILAVLAQFVLIVSIPNEVGWWPADDWRTFFNFMYPKPIYRPLILAPIWGRWAILLAASIGRASRQADPTAVAVCRAMRPSRLLLHAAFPFVITAIYCSRAQNFMIGVIVGMLVFGITYVLTVAMARRGGGQTRQSLFAAAQIAQLSTLALYRLFWPQIHG